MNQQEIKESLSTPFFNYVNGDVIYCNNYTIIDSEFIDERTCLAITHAINNTYGKGINPESVPDMFNALVIVHRYLTNIGSFETAMNIQDILNKATL